MSQTRRNFIKNSAGLSDVKLLTPLENLAAVGMPEVEAKKGFELLFMQTNWGFGGKVDEFYAAAEC